MPTLPCLLARAPLFALALLAGATAHAAGDAHGHPPAAAAHGGAADTHAAPAAAAPAAASAAASSTAAASKPAAPRPAPAAAAAAPAEPVSPAARAALEQLLGVAPAGEGSEGAAADARTTTTVRAGETLDGIIRRTLGDTPFKDNLLRNAFVDANPRAYPSGNIQRLPTGYVLNVPSAADLRRLLLRSLGPERAAALAAGAAPSAHGHAAAPAAAASRPALPPAPPKPEHRGWVRFPG